MRTSKEENMQNRAGKSRIKTATKKVLAAKTKAEAEPLVRAAISELDRMAQKGIIHKNNAANRKSALMHFFNQLPS